MWTTRTKLAIFKLQEGSEHDTFGSSESHEVTFIASGFFFIEIWTEAGLKFGCTHINLCLTVVWTTRTKLAILKLQEGFFATTLLGIWQAHWRWIFDRTPFLTVTVIHRITRFLTALEAELQVES